MKTILKSALEIFLALLILCIIGLYFGTLIVLASFAIKLIIVKENSSGVAILFGVIFLFSLGLSIINYFDKNFKEENVK